MQRKESKFERLQRHRFETAVYLKGQQPNAKRGLTFVNLVRYKENDNEIRVFHKTINDKNPRAAKEEDKLSIARRSVSNSKRRLKNIVRCNYEKKKGLFLTLTYKKDYAGRVNIETAKEDLRQFTYEMKKRGIELKAVATFENKIKNNNPDHIHVHMIIFNRVYIKAAKVRKVWGKGAVFMKPVENYKGVVNYVLKYISKDMLSKFYKKSESRYFATRNLKKEVVERYVDLHNEYKKNELIKRLVEYKKQNKGFDFKSKTATVESNGFKINVDIFSRLDENRVDVVMQEMFLTSFPEPLKNIKME